MNEKDLYGLDICKLTDEQIDEIIEIVKNKKIVFYPIISPFLELSDKMKELMSTLVEVKPEYDEHIINIGGVVAAQLKDEILKATIKRKVYSDYEVRFLLSEDRYDFLIILINEDINKCIEILKTRAVYLHKEEYKNIFHLLKDKIDINEMIDAPSIQINPYFIVEYLSNGGDPSKIDVSKVDCYEDFFDEIDNICKKRNVETPIKFNYTYDYKNIDDFKNKISNLKTKKEIVLFNLGLIGSNHEFEISKEIDYLNQLKDEGYKIYFQYKNDMEDSKIIDLNTIIDSEKFLNMIVDDIKSRNLSPFEQYLLVFQLVRNFKDYKEECAGESLSESRGLYRILNNDYIVCAGYTELLVTLCERLGINAKLEKLISKSVPHARPYFHLIDEKYGIDGFYISEPTWIGRGSLSNLLSCPIMTTEDAAKNDVSKRYDYVLQVKSIEEFKNLSIDERNRLLKYIKKLDPNFYEHFSKTTDLSEHEMQELVDYLSSKVDKKISKRTMAKAITEAQCSLFRDKIDDISKKGIYILALDSLELDAYEIVEEPEFNDYCKAKNVEYSDMTIGEVRKIEPLSSLYIGYYKTGIPTMCQKKISKEEYLELKKSYSNIENDSSVEMKIFDDYVIIMMKRVEIDDNMTINELLSKVELNRIMYDDFLSKLSINKKDKKVL